ncbi:MAG: hypothetical protein M0P02_07855, partial [Sulfurospirillaceae bacterium]|nr:hypothetical protein [Sulfurospirillaceae bacterium]
MNTLDIKREIVQNITTTDVLKSVLKDKYKQPLQKINYMVKIGDLISLKRGVYVFSEKYRIKDLNYILIANILHKPSYVSFEYALSYYGLIPE